MIADICGGTWPDNWILVGKVIQGIDRLSFDAASDSRSAFAFLRVLSDFSLLGNVAIEPQVE